VKISYLGLGFTNALLDTLEVGIEIKRPLIELARGDLDNTHCVLQARNLLDYLVKFS
jgi:hypothetical protein